MLKIMRDHASSWLIKSILWLVVAAFVGTIFYSWGMGEYAERSDEVARVYDEKISYREYSDALENLYDFYRNTFKGQNVEDIIPRSQLKKSALDTVIQRKLVLKEAEKIGIKVSDQEVIDKIRSIPAFQNENQFDNNIYLNFLQYNRMSAKIFENSQRVDILLSKTESLVRESVKVSDLELEDAYKWKHQKINVDYLLISPDTFVGKEQITDAKIAEYYEKEKERFRQPDQIKIEYLIADPADFKLDVKTDEQDIKDYYSDYMDEFMVNEMVRASHILIKRTPAKSFTDENKDDVKKSSEKNMETRKKAEELLERIKKGEDFEKLASKFSQDKGSAKKGGDVGYFSRGKMLAEFEDEAFSLKVGEVSEIVETTFGYHIIKVTDRRETRTKPINEVKDVIKNKLADKRSKKLAKRSLSKILKSQSPISEFVKQSTSGPLVKRTTDFFSAKDKEIPGIEESSKFKIEALSLKENEVSRIVKSDKSFYLLRLLEKKESYIPTLDEVKNEVIDSLSQLERDKLASEKANSLHNELKQGTSLKTLAKRTGIEKSNTDFFERDEAFSKLGMNKTFVDAAFKLKPKESAIVHVNGEYYLVYMLEKADFDKDAYQEEKEEFAKTFLENKKARVLSAWLENLRENAEVTINEQIL